MRSLNPQFVPTYSRVDPANRRSGRQSGDPRPTKPFDPDRFTRLSDQMAAEASQKLVKRAPDWGASAPYVLPDDAAIDADRKRREVSPAGDR